MCVCVCALTHDTCRDTCVHVNKPCSQHSGDDGQHMHFPKHGYHVGLLTRTSSTAGAIPADTNEIYLQIYLLVNEKRKVKQLLYRQPFLHIRLDENVTSIFS